MDARPTISVSFQVCPECRENLPVWRGYLTWCHRCGWNLRPKYPEQRRSLFETFSANSGEHLGRSLLQDVLRHGAVKPGVRPAQLFSFLLAVWVQAPGVGLGFFGVWLLWQVSTHWWALPLGFLCLWLSWVVRPTFDRPAYDYLPAQNYPKLYGLINRVASNLGAKPVERIYARPWFNASASREGWRGSPSLYLGLPLWAVLDGPEKLALLSHELAHLVNGDPSRGALVGGALDTLGRWYAILRPAVPSEEQPGLPRLAMIPVNLLLSVLSLIVWLHALALAALLWRDQQRAEYYADALAAKFCGSQAMLSLLEKLHYKPAFSSALGGWSLNPVLQGANFFDHLRRQVSTTPDRELERIRQVEILERSRLDTRHPPTAYRIHALQALPSHRSTPIFFSDLDWEGIESELAPAYQSIQSELSKNYLSSLYR